MLPLQPLFHGRQVIRHDINAQDRLSLFLLEQKRQWWDLIKAGTIMRGIDGFDGYNLFPMELDIKPGGINLG